MNEIYLVLFFIILGISFIYWIYTRDTNIIRIKRGSIMEFKTSFELSGLPIISFYQGDKVYHFLVDTGSNVSYVNVKSDIKIVPTGIKDVYLGAEGKDMDCEKANIVLYKNGLKYEHIVHVADFNAAFTELKKEYGVFVTGIIGCDFMDRYNYCLDFKEYTLYTRK